MPFDRLVRAVDDWAGRRGRTDVFAQIGPTELRPRHIDWARFLQPPEFRSKASGASLIVAHAGMGSILTALELGKPIVVMPRRGDLGETRNDHQVATVARFRERPGIAAVLDESELAARLDALSFDAAPRSIGNSASVELIETLRRFIAGGIGS